MLYAINVTKYDIIFDYQFWRIILFYDGFVKLWSQPYAYKDDVKYYYAVYIVIIFMSYLPDYVFKLSRNMLH